MEVGDGQPPTGTLIGVVVTCENMLENLQGIAREFLHLSLLELAHITINLGSELLLYLQAVEAGHRGYSAPRGDIDLINESIQAHPKAIAMAEFVRQPVNWPLIRLANDML